MNRVSGVFLAVLLASMMTSSAADDATIHFSSGEQRVTLLELFTSEGCSSCPPADRWLSKLKTDERLWREFVPIAFHVDYWDYIGWRDPFASALNSQRQQRYRLEGGTQVVYTPGFFSNGLEWLGWRDGASVASDNAYGGELSLSVSRNTVTVRYENEHLLGKQLKAHVAVLGMNVESDVRAGENEGRVLKHDFVALDVITVPLNASAGNFEVATKIRPTDQASIEKANIEKAIVAWVSDGETQKPLQAAGGLLPAP